jgi:hypothetical protein
MLERWRLAEAIGVHFSVETLGELLHISGSHINSCMYDINIFFVQTRAIRGDDLV